MLGALGEHQPPAEDVANQAEQEVGLLEGVAVRLEDFLVRVDCVDQQRLLVSEAEVPDEGRAGPFLGPGEEGLVG